jgi:hypothetical protein
MGGFYGNLVVKGSDQASVAKALYARRAIVTPCFDDNVVVFDSVCDDQDTDEIQRLALKLSKELVCTVFSVIVHDDDVLLYLCCRDGEIIDWYNSGPNYFGTTASSDAPAGGNGEALAKCFPGASAEIINATLHTNDYSFETDRHQDLVRELGLPAFTVGTSLASLERGEIPDGLAKGGLIAASDPPPVESPELRWLREFYESLGEESSARRCKRDGCRRGTIPMSVFCKSHHFEMVKGHPCPF